MTEAYELFERCSFVTKYNNSDNTACKTLIAQLKMKQCKRKDHLNAHGCPPSEDMLPGGEMIEL